MERLLTASDVARIFSVHPKSPYTWAKEGLLPVVRIGPRCIRFRESDVADLIERRLSSGMVAAR